jgi:predicted amidohydrolase YtcJ
MFDLAGQTLMPGFVDTHTHWFQSVKRDDFEGGQEELLSQGITTSAELFVDEPLIHELRAFEDAGKLRMRISLYLVHIDNCGSLWGDWYWPDYPVSREDGALIQIPGIKMFNDGGSCNIPAKSFEYPGGGYGDLYYQGEELAEFIIQIQERGYQVAIHGLGDRAIEEIMDAYEIVFAGGPNTYRHRIEHNTLVRDDMLYRYTDLDLVGNIFGYFVGCLFTDGKFAPSPEEYQHWEWRWRSLLDTNPDVHFAWHSDAPLGRPNTMENIHSFVTRLDYREDGSTCEPPAWAADDILTVEEVLPLMTIEAAYALLRDHEIGSLKTGKLADLIILSDNPLDVSTEKLREIPVLLTMVGGNVVYCMGGHGDVCP